MSIIEAIISGLVQGLTEFLPVSSSGHLALIHNIFGFDVSDIFFDICLHLATLVAVIVYFRKYIAGLIERREVIWLVYLGIGTVPAVIAALFFENKITAVFGDPVKVSGMLIVTAFVLFAGQAALLVKRVSRPEATMGRSVIVGIAQAFALVPGISRSGATISVGMVTGMGQEEAFRFSFLLSIPVISGAFLYKILTQDHMEFAFSAGINYIIGMICAFVMGLISLNILKRVIIAKKLYIFGIYCLAAGVAGILFLR